MQQILWYHRILHWFNKSASHELCLFCLSGEHWGVRHPEAEMESMSNQANSFLCFNHSFVDYKKKHWIMGFANPELLHLLKYPKVHLFCDATFRCCPKSFKKCSSWFFDKGTMTFVPVVYILVTRRTEDCHFHALHRGG